MPGSTPVGDALDRAASSAAPALRLPDGGAASASTVGGVIAPAAGQLTTATASGTATRRDDRPQSRATSPIQHPGEQSDQVRQHRESATRRRPRPGSRPAGASAASRCRARRRAGTSAATTHTTVRPPAPTSAHHAAVVAPVERRTPPAAPTATRYGWPSSHALHGAESHTRARSAAPSADRGRRRTTPTARHPAARPGVTRPADGQQHTACDESGLVRVADPDATRQVLEHPQRRGRRRRVTGRGDHRSREARPQRGQCAACTVTSRASTIRTGADRRRCPASRWRLRPRPAAWPTPTTATAVKTAIARSADGDADDGPRRDARGGEQDLRRPELSRHGQREGRRDRHQRRDRQCRGQSRRAGAGRAARRAPSNSGDAARGEQPRSPPVATRCAVANDRGQQDQTDDGDAGAALDVRCTPRPFARRGEDHRGVGDVLDDARRGRTDGNGLQGQQVTVDDADGVQGGVQAERRTADRCQRQRDVACQSSASSFGCSAIRRTAGRISRSGSSVGSAMSVIRPPALAARRARRRGRSA